LAREKKRFPKGPGRGEGIGQNGAGKTTMNRWTLPKNRDGKKPIWGAGPAIGKKNKLFFPSIRRPGGGG